MLFQNSVLIISAMFCSCVPPPESISLLQQAMPEKWNDEAVIILSDSLDLTLKAKSGRNVFYEHRVRWYSINHTSPELLKTLNFYDSEYYQKKPDISVIAYYANGSSKALYNVKRVKYLFSKYDLYRNQSGVFCTQLIVPRYTEVQFIRTEVKNCYIKPEYVQSYCLRDGEYHTLEKRISFSWPREYTVNAVLENGEQLSVRKVNKSDSKQNSICLEADECPRRKRGTCKYPEEWYAALFLSLPPVGVKSLTWKKLGDHYLSKLDKSLQNSTIIDSVADKLAGTIPESADTDSIIDIVFDYVASTIRYYGSWEGVYSFIPRDPYSILKNGYGDCKEMAAVLLLLLRKFGINAYQAIVQTEGYQCLEKYPNLDFGNHVIVCVEKDDGTRHYLDPTNDQYSAASSYYNLLYQKVFVVKKDSSYLDIIKPDSEYQNRVLTQSEISMDESGAAWRIKGEVTFSGEWAIHCYLRIKNRENISEKQIVKDVLKRTLHITANDASVKKLTRSQVVFSYNADFFPSSLPGQVRGLPLNVPGVFTPYLYYSDVRNEGVRYLHKVYQEDSWVVPDGFTLTKFKSLDADFGSGHWSISRNAITRKYRCKFAKISEKHKPMLKEFFNERIEFERGIVWEKR